ncbi:MAG: AAA family ATPase [Clostridia bacterium]|nr:AAA family ATPase [Clostridia bacterium]
MKKTALLNYIFDMAEEMFLMSSSQRLTPDHFVVITIRILNSANDNALDESLNTPEILQEIKKARNVFNRYNVNFIEVINNLLNTVNSLDYVPTADEELFEEILNNVDEDSILTTDALLNMVFDNPTDAIRKTIIDASEDRTITLGNTDEIGFKTEIEDLFGAFKKRPEERRRNPEPESFDDEFEDDDLKEEPEENLAQIITDTQRIQSFLLENVYGQDNAINNFVSGYFQSRIKAISGKEVKKPSSVFLFAGPPGVGKTFLSEKVAEALGLPFKRFDMSEYITHEEGVGLFAGTQRSYKNAKEGLVTSFVADNPKCVILFDEIEKAHLNIMNLFLQILEGGRLTDRYTEEEVSFTQAIIIFTTNAGKNLYEETECINLSTIPRKKIIKALASDKKPMSDEPLFPPAICSRFSAETVVMFNFLDANNLATIAKRELNKDIEAFESATGVKITLDNAIPSTILFSEGGNADARSVSGRAKAFFHEELYELLRLVSAEGITSLKEIKVNVSMDNCDEDSANLFVNSQNPQILVFSNNPNITKCSEILSNMTCHIVDNLEDAKKIMFDNDITLVLGDIHCNTKNERKVLNVEDIDSAGIEFLDYVLTKTTVPTYIIQENDGDISDQEFLSFARIGARDVITASFDDPEKFVALITERCDIAYKQSKMLKLARESKVLSYKTSQTLSEDGSVAEINLYNFHLSLVTDVEDDGSVLDSVSRPNVKFDKVIGAKDAKEELAYFVEYLKDPIKYVRKGVAAPKGVLLYGPPGTGKTLLAKAMAGESNLTFIAAEGNQFIKDGPEGVHNIFKTARKYAPSILFVDEIDAIGKNRNVTDAYSSILTAFLTEMDGFKTDTSKPVFVLAATNYSIEEDSARSLDAALLRRFDRRICVDLPNKDERRQFLEMKIKQHPNVNLSENQLQNACIRSTGMSLAELDSVFELALRMAIRSDNMIIDDAIFEEAFETFNSGEKKKWDKETMLRTARHEAGHALICWLNGEKPSYLTIVSRGDHGGYMQHGDSENKFGYTKAELRGLIRTSMGGRAAEVVYYGNEDGISTGPSGDIYSATRTAEHMICYYGMDEEFGISRIGHDALTFNYEKVRQRINQILEEELKKAIELISKNKNAIDALVDALLENSQLRENEIDEILSANVTND